MALFEIMLKLFRDIKRVVIVIILAGIQRRREPE
jgi:hypothetical protein